jgi:hypothetical protein
MSITINRFAMNGYRTCLVYHIDKGLCIVPNEGTDGGTRIVARENGLDQGGEFMQSECAFDQTPTGCNVKVEKEEESEAISVPHKTVKMGPTTYHPRIQRL